MPGQYGMFSEQVYTNYQDLLRGSGASSYRAEIAKGNIASSKKVMGFGKLITTGGVTDIPICGCSTFALPSQTGTQISFVSDSPNDTSGGTGIRLIDFHYLDSDFNIKIEELMLNGTTPVLSVATDVVFIQAMHMLEVGSLKKADGNIRAYSSAGNHCGIIEGNVRSNSSMRMVPAGQQCIVLGISVASTSGTSAAQANISLISSYFANHSYKDDEILIPIDNVIEQDTGSVIIFPMPFVIPEKEIIGFSVTTDKGATINTNWQGYFEEI